MGCKIKDKKRGFTLIEVMAVIIILAIMALIVTPLILNSIKDSKKSLYETQLENIKTAAKSYMLDLDLEGDTTITITLRELQKLGFVEKDLKNPQTGEEFNKCTLVSVTRIGETYEYDVVESTSTECLDSDADSEIIMILLGFVNETVVHNEPYIEPGVILKRTNNQVLDSSDIRVNIKQYKNGTLIQTITGQNYDDFTTLIDTSDYYEYDIEYTYVGTPSKVRHVKVEEVNDLQCIIVPTGTVNNNGWITGSRGARILSVNSNKDVLYSISVNGQKNYSNNQVIEVGSDGYITVYGYIKDKAGNESACSANLNYEVLNPTCKVDAGGRKLPSGWFIDNVTTNLIANLISPLEQQGMNLNNTKEYNGKSTLTLTSSAIAYGYIKDQAGKEAKCNYNVKIDRTTTVIARIGAVLEGTNTEYNGVAANRNVVLSVNSLNPATTVSGYYFQWYKDDVAIAGATGSSYTATSDGVYKVRVMTGSGIVAYSNTKRIVIDRVLPVVSYDTISSAYPTAKTVKVTATDERFSHMMVHVYKNGAFVGGKSTNFTNSSQYSVTLDSDGTWTIYTQAYDAAGNKQNQAPDNGGGWYYQNYIIDTVKPTATINVTNTSNNGVASGTWSTTALKATFTLGGGAQTVYYCVDTTNTCTPNRAYTSSIPMSANGVSYIRYQASKLVGTQTVVSNIGSYQANIDTENVTCSISLSGDIGNNNWYKSAVTAVNNGSGTHKSVSQSTFTASPSGQYVSGTTVSSYGHNRATCQAGPFYVDTTAPIFNSSYTNVTKHGDGAVSDSSTNEYGEYNYSKTITKYTISVQANDPESGIDYYDYYVLVKNPYYETGRTVNLALGSKNSSITVDDVDFAGSNERQTFVIRACNKAGLCTEIKEEEDCSLESSGSCVNGTKSDNYVCSFTGRSYSVSSTCVSPSTSSSGSGGSSSGGSSCSGYSCGCSSCEIVSLSSSINSEGETSTVIQVRPKNCPTCQSWGVTVSNPGSYKVGGSY